MVRRPMADEFLEVRKLRPLRVIGDRLLVGPPGGFETPAEIREQLIGNIDAKWTDRTGARCFVRLSTSYDPGQFEPERAGGCCGDQNLSSGRRLDGLGHFINPLDEGLSRASMPTCREVRLEAASICYPDHHGFCGR